jgi:hypothetical protein
VSESDETPAGVLYAATLIAFAIMPLIGMISRREPS